eukprot:4241764-Amphidinium_carterae.1
MRPDEELSGRVLEAERRVLRATHKGSGREEGRAADHRREGSRRQEDRRERRRAADHESEGSGRTERRSHG